MKMVRMASEHKSQGDPAPMLANINVLFSR